MRDDDDIDMLLGQAQRRFAEWRRQGERPQAAAADTALLRAGFHRPLTATGRCAAEVIDALCDAAEPGLIGNTRPDFFGWVMGASSPVGVAADLLTTLWGQNAAIYQTSPSAAVAEEAVADWLLDLLDLPRESSVGFTTGATMASFIGLAAARSELLHRAGWDLECEGLFGAPRITAIIGAEAHASVLAVLRQLGFGGRHLQRVPTDDQGRMCAARLAQAMRAAAGPTLVVAQAGHIHSGAFDRLDEIGALCQAQGAWLHVDGAFGLWARCAPSLADLARGAERADSWAVDGHKWLQLPYDAGFAIVRHADAHRRAMGMTASYLNRAAADGRNPSDWVPELSRRARGFAAWAVLQTLGRDGVREMVVRHCRAARGLARRLSGIPGVQIVNEVCLNQVALAFDDEPPGTGARTDAVIEAVRRDGRFFVSGADWQGRRILRVSVIARQTQPAHLDALADTIVRAWDEVRLPRGGRSRPSLAAA